VIVGAGQVGLDVAGRLKALGGANYVVLEKNAVGDNWKKRYDRCKCNFEIILEVILERKTD
jgi:cation diffusion facilitator CzcD-associated flavoprotein CzcO